MDVKVRTYAEIDLDALHENYLYLLSKLSSSVGVLAVIKADAYGHGALPVGRCLERAGVKMLGVANVSEGIELREGGIKAPVVLLGGSFPGEEREVIEYRLTPVLYHREMAEGLAQEARRLGVRLPVHIKVDTGMGRLGIPWQEAPSFFEWIKGLPSLKVEGLMSHFSSADEEDKAFSQEQLSRFQGVVEEAERRGLSPAFLHIANSAALLTFPPSHFNMVRPGIILYGAHPTLSFKESFPQPLRPVMSLKSRIAAIKPHPPSSPISYGRTYHTRKESLIATVPIGYADGYPRRLSNKGKVLVRGRRVQVVGVVTMDWIMVDVSEVPGVRIGDEVVLIGKQGREEISVEEVACWADTIPYEILCGVGKRVPRVYKGAEG